MLENLVVFVALFATGHEAMDAAGKNQFGESIGALFSLPFILFSDRRGGFLADRNSKRTVMLGVKIFELVIMAVVFAGLWTMKQEFIAGVRFSDGNP